MSFSEPRYTNSKKSRSEVYTASTTAQPEAPIDKHNLGAYIILLLGIASLLPWNFFITANDFWMYKFRDVNANTTQNSTDELTPLQLYFQSYLTIASSLPFIIFLIINTALSERISCNVRVESSLFGSILMFLVITTTAIINTDGSQNFFLGATLTMVVLVNMLSGILQGGGTGATGCLPEKYMTIKAIGQALAGVVASLAQIACLLLDVAPSTTAIMYFGFATAILVATQIAFAYLKKTEFYTFYVCESSREVLLDDESDEVEYKPPRRIPFWSVFKDGWQFHVSIMLILILTLAAFPGIASLIKPGPGDHRDTNSDKMFVTLVCFLAFNLADMAGRIIAMYAALPIRFRYVLLAAAVSRIVFLPLFLLCYVAPASRYLISPVFTSDWQYIIIMVAFGISNGYIMTLALAYAPKTTSVEYQEVAGSMVAAFDGLGLFIGSMSSYLTHKLL